MANPNEYSGYFPTWCPGCGNFGIWGSLKDAFSKLGWQPDQFAIVYGVGCSGNMNDFVKAYGLHSLHGRAIPNAIGLKLANHTLPVVVIGGDGDLTGEGGNHLMHGCRGNYDMTVFIHNNQVYGLTTGQVSPTSSKGHKSKSTPEGIIEEPVNPLALALTQGATFVGQAFAGDIPHLTDMMMQAINHKGFSVVSIYQPCVTFNKINTYMWFRERIYKLDESHNKTDRVAAYAKTIEQDKIPLGVLYQVEKPTYEEQLAQLAEGSLVQRQYSVDINNLIEEFV
ncbi:MAG TPA: 2-oxoacid:ferredoxin oxidoreductase subunit beta [Patescibacteria group bacterium]|nr:2-oxoacid:ferredoxin oxidoreductase subunit beta [Patescibacteria group bacterium]